MLFDVIAGIFIDVVIFVFRELIIVVVAELRARLAFLPSVNLWRFSRRRTGKKKELWKISFILVVWFMTAFQNQSQGLFKNLRKKTKIKTFYRMCWKEKFPLPVLKLMTPIKNQNQALTRTYNFFKRHLRVPQQWKFPFFQLSFYATHIKSDMYHVCRQDNAIWYFRGFIEKEKTHIFQTAVNEIAWWFLDLSSTVLITRYPSCC